MDSATIRAASLIFASADGLGRNVDPTMFSRIPSISAPPSEKTYGVTSKANVLIATDSTQNANDINQTNDRLPHHYKSKSAWAYESL